MKTTLLYEAGCYGEFTYRLLNLQNIESSESFIGSNFKTIYTTPYRGDHHLIDEHDINGHVTKITFNNLHCDLINRNKWTKVKGHLEEQAEQTFPNIKNNKIYTIAINKCNLLDESNLFKKMEIKTNTEIKFQFFLENLDIWLDTLMKLFDNLKIPFDTAYINKCYDAFKQSQKHLIENKDKDEIYFGNLLGEEYFKKHKKNFNRLYFDELYNQIGGKQ